MLKTILLALAVILILAVGAVLALAATRPDTFRVQRSVTIKAPPEKIFPMINDFSQWRRWSPYDAKDPAMRRTLSGPTGGPPAGIGAVYEWAGDRNVGAGRMEITESDPARRVIIQLDFLKPFAASNIAIFALAPDGDGTTVTWIMDGPATLLTKVMDMIFDMDRMIGADFATGLDNLKQAAEA